MLSVAKGNVNWRRSKEARDTSVDQGPDRLAGLRRTARSGYRTRAYRRAGWRDGPESPCDEVVDAARYVVLPGLVSIFSNAVRSPLS